MAIIWQTAANGNLYGVQQKTNQDGSIGYDYFINDGSGVQPITNTIYNSAVSEELGMGQMPVGNAMIAPYAPLELEPQLGQGGTSGGGTSAPTRTAVQHPLVFLFEDVLA